MNRAMIMPESPPEPPIFAAVSDNDAAAGQSAARKITLSGCRRMAKTAAMGRLGAEHDRRLTLMAAAHDLVGGTLAGLMFGAPGQGLTAGRTPRA